MTLKQKTDGLRARLLADAEAARARAIKEADDKIRIAEAWDASGYERLAPDFFMSHNSAKHYAGSAGHLSFRDVPVYEALALLDAFPPIPCGLYRDGNTSTIRPIGTQGERYTLERNTDGLVMRVDGGLRFGPTVKLEWWSEVSGLRLDFTVELTAAYGNLPRLHAETVTYGHEVIRYAGPSSLIWPLPFHGNHIRYARGSDTAHNPHTVYSDVRDYLERVQAKLDAEGRESLAAYEAAAANLPAPRAATDAECEAHRRDYDRAKLRAGTLRQEATLATPEALAHAAVAERHWREYAKARGLTVGKYGTDRYAATVWYLEQCGLLTDDGYKYGSAWL